MESLALWKRVSFELKLTRSSLCPVLWRGHEWTALLSAPSCARKLLPGLSLTVAGLGKEESSHPLENRERKIRKQPLTGHVVVLGEKLEVEALMAAWCAGRAFGGLVSSSPACCPVQWESCFSA